MKPEDKEAVPGYCYKPTWDFTCAYEVYVWIAAAREELAE